MQDDAGEDKVNQLTKYIEDEIRVSDKADNTNETKSTEDTLALKHLQFLVKLDINIRLYHILLRFKPEM